MGTELLVSLKCNPSGQQALHTYLVLECAYVLRFVERTERGGRKKPWSLRQYAVYHRFKPGQNGCSTWFLVGASQRMSTHLDQYTRSVDDIKAVNPFELHTIFLDTVIASWRPYLVYITQLVFKLSSKATGVCITAEDDGENFVTITVEDHQQLKQIEDDVTDLILCLDSTSDTLTTFAEMYERFRHDSEEARPVHALDAVAVALAEKAKEIRYTKRKAEALQSKVQNTRTLISSLLERQSGHNINHQIGALHKGNNIMHTIAEKNSRDSSSMRVLTIITMIYLPCTIVSNFYSTQFVHQIEGDGTSTKMGYTQDAWVFFAISVPLTVVTFLVWYSWIHMADMRNLVAAQLSTKKKAESPV
ncbi:hypothetical protein N0V91_011165 [Didymella pomorum]|uniref:CorA-like transporter domain-containing protein n=1 Tax=Didymella pomorum TaxID=749634 RepID=A0A9W9D0K2_9PLEO|nr:hypothetical protein N0V91_011165 [Didymella pomorum]